MTGLLEGKVALVTGAGHGIGRAHALELAKHGAKVVVNDLGGSARGEGADRVAEQVCEIIAKRGGTAIPDFGDVSDEVSAEAMIQRAVSEFGKLDILVNNAGIVRDKAIWNMSAADFDLVTRVHLRGTWLTSHFAAKHWRERYKNEGKPVNGRLINTVSGAGLLGNFGQSNYATAKAATMGLTLTLSLELYSMGVTVNAIGPGALTRIVAEGNANLKVREADEIPEEEWSANDPATSSPVVAWLASDEAQLVTGQCIRAIGEKIYLMGGWTEEKIISSGGKRWQATELGKLFATDLFGTRARGLILGGS